MYKVIRQYKDRETGKTHRVGETVSPSTERARILSRKGMIEKMKEIKHGDADQTNG